MIQNPKLYFKSNTIATTTATNNNSGKNYVKHGSVSIMNLSIKKYFLLDSISESL